MELARLGEIGESGIRLMTFVIKGSVKGSVSIMLSSRAIMSRLV